MVHTETLDFLTSLGQNNNKEWFHANAKAYAKVKANYLSMATTVLEVLKKIDEKLEGVSPKDCMFRINRDIRFSPDKSPYKTNLGLVFQSGGKKSVGAAFYIHIDPKNSFIAGGVWMPDSATLTKIRKEIYYFNDDFFDVINSKNFLNTFGGLDMDTKIKLIKPPRGFDADHPAIEYIKLKSFTATTNIDIDLLSSNNFLDEIIRHYKTLKPLIDFLDRGLESNEDGGL